MNYCVPDFESDEDYSIPASNSGLMRPKKSVMGGDEDIMELLWQNGQVVMQSQNQRSGGKNNKPHNKGDVIEQTPPFSREIRSAAEVEETTPSHLFMQEEEMASWLHCSMDDSSFDRYLYSDLLYAPPVSAPISLPPTSAVTVAPRPPIPSSRCVEPEPPAKYQNFVHFSRPRTSRTDSGGPSTSNKTPAAKDLTVVDSNKSPANGPESRVSRVADSAAPVYGGNNFLSGTTSGIGGAAGTSSLAREIDMCELTVTSSPGTGSGASASAEQSSQMPAATATMTAGDRKRKGREADATTTTDYHREDLDFECTDAKKQACGSTSAKRSRAAEVHNLSERRRRDRINEKMKALQELIPRCNKSDKASMLDEAIEYLKSLQMQVQMMSMGCSMVPMMFPGVQQYMPPMGMGMGMRMGVGMDMGVNHAMVPYPSLLPGSAMPASAAAAAHLAPRFPVPAFQMPPVPVADPSRTGPMNSLDPRMNSYVPQNPNQARMPCFADPYQHYLTLQQAQLPLPQAQAVMHPSTTKASSSKDANPEHQHAG